MIGKTISHYKILEKLGEGGMGVVYKAQDTKLDRTVALKFLPSHLTKNETDLKRFVQEAKAAAALNHPNVCTIHEIHDEGENPFIVMEYVEGRTLRDRIGRGEVTSPLQQVIDYAIQIAEALRAAHKKGIVHRDIKSENIMITEDGRVKIMDFGLAKFKGSAKLTKTGITVGTFAYMSPEQFQKAEVDHRTDIWSFGVVLFEMLTGQLPFEGDYEAAVMYSVLNEKPRLESLYDLPQNIRQVIQKALEKMPDYRWQTTQEILNVLKLPETKKNEPERQEISIVVLPFENLGPDPEQEYFSDGLTEELITDLSQLHSLRVISRNSTMMLKGFRKDTKAIGKELNVQYVLEGSVRKSGHNLRITVQLTDIAKDTPQWAEKYTGTLDDVFDIQEMVSRAVVQALRIKLSIAEDLKLAERSIKDIYAYECYLKARKESMRMTESGFNQALQLLNDGISKIGDNEVLYAMAGQIHVLHVMFGIKTDSRYLKRASEYAEKVFELNSDSSYGHLLSGMIKYKEKDTVNAIYHLRKALLVEPDERSILFWLSLLYIITGEESSAKPLIDRLIQVDPLMSQNYSLLGYFHLVRGDFQLANEAYHQMYMMDPHNPFTQIVYARGLAFNDHIDEAVKILDLLEKEPQKTVFSRLGVFFKYALLGDKKKALDSVSDDLLKTAEWDEHNAWYLAESYALIDDINQALFWLEKAIDRGLRHHRLLCEYDRFLNNLHSDEGFKVLMKRLKKGWIINKKHGLEKQRLDQGQEKSIIVLPFENMSPDPEQEYFSDGLTEEIITDLSHIHDLLVISRSSAMTFKGTHKTIPEIARAVNVRYVLEGSVRKAGNNLRITAQLIDSKNDAHIWAEKYSGTLEDVFDIQEKVSQSIVQSLRLKLSTEEINKINERPIDNAFAYDCYLRAYREIMSFSQNRFDYALNFLQKGIEIIGPNAVIYAGIAFTYFQYANLGIEQEKHIGKAEEFLKKAFNINSESAEAYFVLGCINQIFHGNAYQAIHNFQRAHSIKPDDPEIMMWLNWGYLLVGRMDEAMSLVERCITIDPINPGNHSMMGINRFFKGQFDLALEPLLHMCEMVPDSPMWQFWKSIILLYNDCPNESYAFINEYVKEPGKDTFTQLMIFLKYVLKGDNKKLSQLLTPDFLQAVRLDCQFSWHIGSFYSYREEKDQSLDWLENAVARGFINYPFLSKHDKLLENLRGEERFKKLMKRVKHEWENFEV